MHCPVARIVRQAGIGLSVRCHHKERIADRLRHILRAVFRNLDVSLIAPLLTMGIASLIGLELGGVSASLNAGLPVELAITVSHDLLSQPARLIQSALKAGLAEEVRLQNFSLQLDGECTRYTSL